MFFRRKRSPTGQVLQLLESYRSAEGQPRQRVVVSLGKAAMAEEDQVAVARAVEAQYYKVAEPELLSASLSRSAQQWVDQIVRRVDRAGRWQPWLKPAAAEASCSGPKLDGVLVEEVTHTHATVLGPLLVGWRAWEQLGLPQYLAQLGFSPSQTRTAAVSTELGGLKDDLTRLQQQNKMKEERITALQGTIEEMQRNLAMIADVLVMKPTVEAVQQALTLPKRQKET